MKHTVRDSFTSRVFKLEDILGEIKTINNDLPNRKLKPILLDQILHEIKYKINFPTKNKIVSELETGGIILVSDVAPAIPVWAIASASTKTVDTAVVPIGKIVRIVGDSITFNVREVFALAQVGYVIKNFYTHEKKIMFNYAFLGSLTKIYVRMMIKLLDIIYSIDTIQQYALPGRYLIAKFFLIYLCDKEDNEQTDQMAYNVVKGAIGQDALKMATKNLSASAFESFESFIKALSENFSILKDMTTSTIVSKAVTTYGARSVIMLDNLNYLIAGIISVTVSGNFLRDFALEQSVGKDGLDVYSKFFDICK